MLESAFRIGLVPDLSPAATSVEGFVDTPLGSYYVIPDAAVQPPFLMSVIGASDVWLFLSSNGALTAGRRDPDQALLPYYTEDKLADSAGATGGFTLIRGPWAANGATWQPFSDAADGLGPRERWIAKSTLGDQVILGEGRPALGLRFQVAWTTSARFGLVRHCRLSGETSAGVQVLDGLRNLLPADVTRQVQNELSVLLDAYKRSEIVDGLGIYSLSSRLTDLARPAEALRATVAWRVGPRPDHWQADESGIATFRATGEASDALDRRGVRGAYLAAFEADPSDGPIDWTLVADTGLDTASVCDLAARLRDPDALLADLAADIEAGRRRFDGLLAGCDAGQLTGDRSAVAHHVASAAFSAMRGGVPLDGHHVHKPHLLAFLAGRNRDLVATHRTVLDALPDRLTRGELVAWGAASGDADLERLTLEFLPLTFGRRHGDPSRPWNRFEIALTDDQGDPSVSYQGNWRDIFQNWEALAWSYPAYVEGMVATFVSATTIDGYNPYRITHTGVDWEEPEPDNPWANIGYWSDHQIVYLARLLEASRRFHPGALEGLLDRPIFTTADVPYRLAGLDATLANPFDTVAFAEDANAAARSRAEALGGDGLLRRTADGVLHRSTLADKLVLLLAAKLVNFVPDAGIWMNTQRPEWNDANNALVGRGASVVTTAQLLGYVDLVAGLVKGRRLTVRGALADLVGELLDALRLVPTASGLSDADRLRVLRASGEAGERYRERAYAGEGDEVVTLEPETVDALLTLAHGWLTATLRSNRRDDGLTHSYNTLDWDADGVRIGRLPLMLEGQVALLGSGVLDADEAVGVTRALRDSALYRADQHSYVLYPDRELPGFLGRNTVEQATPVASLDALADDPRRPIVVRDAAGALHFAADLTDASVLAERLTLLAAEPRYADTLPGDCQAILDAYEATFNHRAFTGRSQSFFAYEGLGSVYWHMVSKLALAVRECWQRARHTDPDAASTRALGEAYADIRAGLGFCKTAAEFGAFPADPYSHTPAHAGAKQPGMTGQVKEDLLNRLGELGLRVADGVISFDPGCVPAADRLSGDGVLRYRDITDAERTIAVPSGGLAFTVCQVPVVVLPGEATIEVEYADGSRAAAAGTALSLADSQSVLARSGRLTAIRVGCASGGGAGH